MTNQSFNPATVPPPAACRLPPAASYSQATLVPAGARMLHPEVFALRIDLGKTICTGRQINRLVAGQGAGGLQIRYALGIEKPPAMRGFTRYRESVAGQHLARDTQAPKCSDQLLGIGSRRIEKRHQPDQSRRAGLWAASHCQRSMTLRGGFADARIQCFDRCGQHGAGLGERANGTFQHT